MRIVFKDSFAYRVWRSATWPARRVDRTLRDPGRGRRMMRSLARLQGTQSSASVVKADMEANDSEGLTLNTVYSYLKAMKRIFVTEELR